TALIQPEDNSISTSLSSTKLSAVNSSTLTIKTTPSTPPKVYHIFLKGNAGQINSYITAMITVPYGPDFQLFFTPQSIDGQRGGSVEAQLSIKRSGGNTGNVTITPPNTQSIKVKIF